MSVSTSASANWIGLQIHQRPAERLAAPCVVECDRERLGGQADRDRRDVDARHVDRSECRAHALAGRRDLRVGRHVHLVVGDLADGQERARGLVVEALDAHAVGARIDGEHEDVAGAALRSGAADEHEHVRLAGQRDPGLASGHAPAVVDGDGLRRDGGCVRAGVGLGEREAAQQLAAHEARPVAVAQLGLAEARDRVGDRVVHREREGVGRVAATELLEHVHRTRQRRGLAAHVLGREEPQQPVGGCRLCRGARERPPRAPSRAPRA